MPSTNEKLKESRDILYGYPYGQQTVFQTVLNWSKIAVRKLAVRKKKRKKNAGTYPASWPWAYP